MTHRPASFSSGTAFWLVSKSCSCSLPPQNSDGFIGDNILKARTRSKCRKGKCRRRLPRPLQLRRHARPLKQLMQTNAPIVSVTSISLLSTLTPLPASGQTFGIHRPCGFAHIPATSHSLTSFSWFRCARMMYGLTTSPYVSSDSHNLGKSDKFTSCFRNISNTSMSLTNIEKNNVPFECPRTPAPKTLCRAFALSCIHCSKNY